MPRMLLGQFLLMFLFVYFVLNRHNFLAHLIIFLLLKTGNSENYNSGSQIILIPQGLLLLLVVGYFLFGDFSKLFL